MCICCKVVHVKATNDAIFLAGVVAGMLHLAANYPISLCPLHKGELAHALVKTESDWIHAQIRQHTDLIAAGVN
jgi:hypothetical protein